ncbi:MAG: superoxide dismutase [Ni] [Planctomycetota bacterium]|nr:superoxide dismutase [Ni] [Planctomycetota bacterium]
MQRLVLPILLLCFLPLAELRVADAHCEVPCGIFADQRRFEEMLEDTATMKKAMEQVGALAGKSDVQSLNQLVRWVTTKEEHAKNTQHVIAQYFMAQRIKPEQSDYVARLTAAHAIITQAMKCKQSADPAEADKLKAAIIHFHGVYEPDAKKAEPGHGHGHK